jgi:signal transduction histidine kinase
MYIAVTSTPEHIMRLSPRQFLLSGRRFYTAVTVVFVLLIGTIFGYEAYTLQKLLEIADSNLDSNAYLYCLNKSFELKDFSWDTFARHVEALNDAPVHAASPEDLQTLVDKLAALPGVRQAYCLEDGQRLYAGHGPAPLTLVPALAERRIEFGTYNNGGTRPSIKFQTLYLNRVRFRDVPFQGDTLRMILGAFDRSGAVIHMLPEVKDDPSLVRHLFALDMDPHWIKQAVAEHMADVFRGRWTFVLSSPYPFDTTGVWLHGLGIIALGDTVWWEGLKSIGAGKDLPSGGSTAGRVMGSGGSFGEPWLQYCTVYRTDPADLKLRDEYLRGFYLLLGGIAVATLILALALVWGLVFVRKQWLARQTALTHLAHSIRTPVARLRLEVDTFREKRTISPQEEADVVQSIGNECGRIERAVQNAALSLNDQQPVMRLSENDLARILTDALRPWKSSFHLAGVALELPPEWRPLPGRYDREMIVTLLDNLLDNALRHTRTSLQKQPARTQTVAVSVICESGWAVLSVDDSDGGVPASDRQRIFRRFDRGSDPALTGASGLGLGLALVKEIAEAHGGSVSVGSSDLGGARFTVKLPTDDHSLSARN